MAPRVHTEHLGGTPPSGPRKYRVKATEATGVALAPSARPNDTHRQMTNGERHFYAVTLLMDGTGEIRTYTTDALDTLS
jgi:hypothetical protein